MTKNSIGQFIQALRKASGMTQQELADSLNVSNKAVSRWERDECAPDLSLIPAIAEMFGVTCDELLRGERNLSDSEQKSTGKGTRQLQALIKRAIEKFKTSNLVAIALAICGFICMVGIYYGLQKSKYYFIAMVVMGLFEIISCLITVISIVRLQSVKADCELYDIEPRFSAHCNRVLANFSYASFLTVLAAFLFSIAVQINLATVIVGVQFNESTMLAVLIALVILLFTALSTKRAYTDLFAGKNVLANKVLFGLNLTQLVPYLLSIVAIIYVRDKSVESFKVVLYLCYITIAILVISPIVFAIKYKNQLKSFLVSGIRNALLTGSVLVALKGCKVLYHDSVGEYFFIDITYVQTALIIAAAFFAVAGIVNIIVKRKKPLQGGLN